MPSGWLLLCLASALAGRAAAAGAAAPAGGVVHVQPLGEEAEEVQDGSDDLGFSGGGQPPADHVTRLWGVSDATARADRLFVHAIDKDAFRGSVARYEVGGAGGHDPLPRWLTFDPGRGIFSGVPLGSELGPQLVTVRAIGTDGHSSARDRFMVDVVREREAELSGRPEGRDGESGELSCADDSAVTVLSVYFDTALQSLDGGRRLALLRSVAERLGVDAGVIQVSSLTEDGDTAARTGLSWRVGCAGLVRADQEAAVRALRADPRLAGLSSAAGQPAVSWQLSARQPAGRHRRQADTETDGSGAWPDDTYDYSDYYDYDDYGEDPASRVVPSLPPPSLGAPPASPVYVPRVSVWRMSTPVPVPVRPTVYPDLLQPSREPGRPSEPPRHTTQLESSLAVAGGRVEATARLPEGAVRPTAGQPEPAEPSAVPNFPPYVKQHMRKPLLVAGKAFRQEVPEATFEDLESGPTRRLRLTLRRADGRPLDAEHWLQFDPESQHIYGLPHEEDVGEYRFSLAAQDEQGLTASEPLPVAVRLHQQWRALNHRFYLTFKLLQPNAFARTVDWELLLLKKLAAMFGQESTDSLLVYDIRKMDGFIRLGWVNDTVSTHRCDKLALAHIASQLLGKDGSATALLRKVLLPEFGAQKVRLELLNVCHGARLASLPAPATEPPRENTPPQRLLQLDSIAASVGKLLRLQVPTDTFFDEEDGSAREMELRLLTSERQRVPRTSWLQFEPKNQEFIGLPLDKDVGQSHFLLECVDSGGLKAFDSIEVVVSPRQTATDYTAEFGVTLDNEFASFDGDPLQKQRLMQKLAALIGDSGPGTMLVHSIRSGSVIFSWFNESLPRDRCPDAAIQAVRSALLEDSGQVLPAAVQALGPEFRLTAARVTPRGLCLAETTPTSRPAPTNHPHHPPDQQAPESKGDEYLVTFIVPAVVIAAMLIIAGLIACVLYRARRRGKMTMTDSGTYVSRGIPVIFSDELEDRMEKNAKTPVMLTNERPPEPPTYPADGAPSPATPMLEEPPYERPPPFSGGEPGRPGRAKPVPNYRQPPPYVPP